MYGFLISCHGNKCPYLHTDHLLMNRLPGVMNCEAVYCSVRYNDVFICIFHSTVWEFHHRQVATLSELSNNLSNTARDVTGSVYDL